jgi:hypothetical protein
MHQVGRVIYEAFRHVARHALPPQSVDHRHPQRVNALEHGRNTVRPATMGFEHGWKMRQRRVTPHYTTRLAALPVASLGTGPKG